MSEAVPLSAAKRVSARLNAPIARNAEPMRLGEAFRRYRYEIAGHATLVRWARAWWRYDGVRYVEHDDEMLDTDIAKFLDVVEVEVKDPETQETSRRRITARTKTISDVRRTLPAVMPSLGAAGSPAWIIREDLDPKPESLLACANGLLDLRYRKLVDPTPRLFATTAIGAAWLPDAEPPQRWLAFLESMWGEDKESIRALQQMFGYLLTSDTSQQKMFAIIGPKRSGKGTIARILKALLGDDAVVNPTLQSLERPFGLAPLVGKTVAIIGDARLGGQSDQAQVVERLLSISGEDPLSIDRKNRDPINVRLRTRVLLLSNELPRLYDSSGAIASRFLILQTARSFYGEEDTQLEQKLLAELPGIFRWAVDGLEDLQEAGRFCSPLASERAIEELESLSAPLRVFVRDCCVIAPALQVEIPALYERYQQWCKDNGRDKPANRQIFGRDLHTSFPHLTESQPRRPDGKRIRVYQGIGLSYGVEPAEAVARDGVAL